MLNQNRSNTNKTSKPNGTDSQHYVGLGDLDVPPGCFRCGDLKCNAGSCDPKKTHKADGTPVNTPDQIKELFNRHAIKQAETWQAKRREQQKKKRKAAKLDKEEKEDDNDDKENNPVKQECNKGEKGDKCMFMGGLVPVDEPLPDVMDVIREEQEHCGYNYNMEGYEKIDKNTTLIITLRRFSWI